MVNMEDKKYCSYCDATKELKEFPPSTTSPDGCRSECRLCSTTLKRLMKKIKSNPEGSESLQAELAAKRVLSTGRKSLYKLKEIDQELVLIRSTPVKVAEGSEDKYCSSCERTLPKTEEYFHKSKHTVDGFRHSCTPCKGIADKLERVYKKNPELKPDKKATNDSREKKRIASNQRKYNSDYPLQNLGIREKMASTVKDRYGVENYSTHKDYEAKRQATTLKNHGVTNYFKHPTFKKRQEATNLEKYGKKYPSQKDCWMLPNNLSIVDYARQFNKNVAHCRRIYEHYSFDELKAWCEEDKRPSSRTMPEKIAENLLGLQFFGSRLVLENNQHRYPDFKVNDSTYLDVDGLYWHSVVNLEPKHHFTKRQQYESKGLQLIQIREDELSNSPDIVKSMLASLAGDCESIYARKCEVKKVTWADAKEFFSRTHLQGIGTTAKVFGLFHDDKLVQALSFRNRRKEPDSIEIARFSSELGFRVVGGFSRLLKAVIRQASPKKVYSFCDLRYSQGKVYEVAGFEAIRETLGWNWTDFHNTFNRLKCTAGDGRTELQNAEEKGWVRIYDAGQRLYLLKVEH